MNSGKFDLRKAARIFGYFVGLGLVAFTIDPYTRKAIENRYENDQTIARTADVEISVEPLHEIATAEDSILSFNELSDIVSGESVLQPVDSPVKNGIVRTTPLHTTELSSPNFDHGYNRNVDLIVLHTSQGSGMSAWHTFMNANNKPRVSAHYLIMEEGDICSFVREEDIAWHCRGFNDNSIGIEIAGFYDKPIGDVQVQTSQKLIIDIQNRYGLGKNSVKAHSELDPDRRKDPGESNFSRILSGI